MIIWLYKKLIRSLNEIKDKSVLGYCKIKSIEWKELLLLENIG